MTSLFLSPHGRCRDTWRQAFPDLSTRPLASPPAHLPPEVSLVWVLSPADRDPAALVAQLSRSVAGRPLVVLADEPQEEQALSALAAGAAGYCNGHAAASVLTQVALAVNNGGVWVGQGLMQRLLGATARGLANRPAATEARAAADAWREKLSARELEAAGLLAQGASNKEIAQRMEISERTVKAHLGALFEKVGARDRLHLSLIINGIDVAR